MKPQPGELELPARLLEAVLNDLEDWGARRCESLVMLLGRRNGNVATVSTAVYADPPGVERGPGWLRLSENWMLQLTICAEERSEIVVAHVHSHGMEAFLSDTDEHHIFHARGCFSFIVPDFAQSNRSKSFDSWAGFVGVDGGLFAPVTPAEMITVSDDDGAIIVLSENGWRNARPG